MIKGPIGAGRRLFNAARLWLLPRFPPLITAFDRAMASVAALIIIFTLAAVIFLATTCAPPIAILNFAGLGFLALSIPVSLIRGKYNWVWPVVLALAGLALWVMSTMLGSHGIDEIWLFFAQISGAGCPG